MAAETDAAAHVALEREEDPLVRHAALPQRLDGEVDHHLGPADEGGHGVGPELGRSSSFGTTPTLPFQRRVGRVDGDLHGELVAPVRELVGVEQVARRARAVEHGHGAEAAPPRERVEDDRAQRREPDAAGDDDDVPALRRLDRPAVAERAAQAEHGAGLRGADRVRHRADVAHREDDGSPGCSGRAADRDRHLPHAERVHHHELARLDREAARRRARASSVHVSTVSCRRSATRNGSGTNAPAALALRLNGPSP